MRRALITLSDSAGSSGAVPNVRVTKKQAVLGKRLIAHFPDFPLSVSSGRVLGLVASVVSLQLYNVRTKPPTPAPDAAKVQPYQKQRKCNGN